MDDCIEEPGGSLAVENPAMNDDAAGLGPGAAQVAFLDPSNLRPALSEDGGLLNPRRREFRAEPGWKEFSASVARNGASVGSAACSRRHFSARV